MTKYFKGKNMVAREIEGETILVPIRQRAADLDSIYTLNKVGSRVWKLIDGKRTAKEIKNLVLKEFKVSKAQVEKDVARFLAQLEKIGAIKSKE
jgi:hypothetical protein